MNHIPMRLELMSDQQKLEVIVHMEQLFLAMLAADSKLLSHLDPAWMPNDLAAQVRQYADAQRDLVNASRAELERICAPVPQNLQ